MHALTHAPRFRMDRAVYLNDHNFPRALSRGKINRALLFLLTITAAYLYFLLFASPKVPFFAWWRSDLFLDGRTAHALW